jgi:Flp pilus assembly pilin Flp
MTTIQNQLIAAHTVVTAYIAGAFERLQNEKGQGSVEYAGIVLLVAALVAAAIAAANTDVISGPVKEKIGAAFDKLT